MLEQHALRRRDWGRDLDGDSEMRIGQDWESFIWKIIKCIMLQLNILM